MLLAVYVLILMRFTQSYGRNCPKWPDLEQGVIFKFKRSGEDVRDVPWLNLD